MKLFLAVFSGFFMGAAPSLAFTLISSQITGGWNIDTLAFDVNETSCSALGVSVSDLEADLDAAIELWNRAPTTSLKLARGTAVTSGNTGTNPPHIVCNSGVITSPDVVPGEALLSTLQGGRPASGYIQINGDSTKAAYYPKLTATQRQIVLAHEMGHILGLGHAEKDYALMYYDISSKQYLNLSQDDIDGLTWLNPRDELKGGMFGCGSLIDVSKRPPPGSGPGGMLGMGGFFLFAFLISRARRNSRPQTAPFHCA